MMLTAGRALKGGRRSTLAKSGQAWLDIRDIMAIGNLQWDRVQEQGNAVFEEEKLH